MLKDEYRSIWSKYVSEFSKAMKNKYFRTGLTRATEGYEHGIRELHRRFPQDLDLAKEVRKIKENSISNLEKLLKIAKKKLEEKGAKVYFAKSGSEVFAIIKEIVGTGKVIVKSKSITSEEIRLREFLEELGNEVWETDLGEFIIQLLKDRPMHIVTPALHVPREKVAETFTKFFGKKFDPQAVEDMVRAASEFLRDKYYKADFGIIGANVIGAYDGTIVLIHNEGNIRFSALIPKNLIVLAGIEKVVPTLEEALKVVYITSRFAKYKVAGYYDVYGSSEDFRNRQVYIIFLDNGRKQMIEDPAFTEAAYCLRCGACMYSCPVFKIIAGKFGGPTYMGGIGTIWTYFIDGELRAIPAIYSCLLDGRCVERCPLNIDVPRMIKLLRFRIVKGE